MTDMPDDLARLRRAALIAAPVSALLLYALCVGALLVVLRAVPATRPGGEFGGAVVAWATYGLPAVVAPAAGALFSALLYGRTGRRAAYWPNFGLLAGFTALALIWLLLAGGTWNTIFALVQLGCGVLAWLLLRGATRGDAKRRA